MVIPGELHDLNTLYKMSKLHKEHKLKLYRACSLFNDDITAVLQGVHKFYTPFERDRVHRLFTKPIFHSDLLVTTPAHLVSCVAKIEITNKIKKLIFEA